MTMMCHGTQIVTATILLLCLLSTSEAFTTIYTSATATAATAAGAHVHPSTTALYGSTSRNSNDDGDDDDDNPRYSPHAALLHNRARTDVRNLLTQRAFQSFLFLLETCRDPHTITWLEETFGWQNLENYHGTGFFNLTRYETWDTLLLELMSQPPGVVIVKAKRRGRGHGGWSKDNPYLQERFVEFEIDIDPVSLASRILSVREQLAAEWARDLDAIISANELILKSYQDHTFYSRHAESDDDDDNECSNMMGDNHHHHQEEDDPEDCAKRVVFDRYAQYFFYNSNSFTERQSSPLRKGNFDLLMLLATQESVHRVLRSYRDDADAQRNGQNSSFAWLMQFYTERIKKFFDGNQEYGRGDDFLEELFMSSPSVKSEGGRGGRVQLMDPIRIAEDVLRMRSTVAADWKGIVTNVPADHTGVRRRLLELQMDKWGQRQQEQSPSFPTATSSSSTDELGEFQ